jgi:GntR family transcriptional regulator/MocR family aminotransferase
LTPAHQYPTGVTLNPGRRTAAVQWARAVPGRIVVEDDYDGEFRFDRQPVGALQGTAPDHVVYIGTASKTLAPALRLAWMVVPDRLVEPLDEAKRYADRQTDTIGQLTLADLIATHDYDRHVRAGRLRYRDRRDLLVERLGRRLKLDGIAAGLHALIRLPDTGPSEADVLAAAAEQGLGLGGLTSHWHAADESAVPLQGTAQGLIVGYGTPGTNAYPAALDILARVLRAV